MGLWALHHGSWLKCNGSHNYQVTVSLHFFLFCFLFACIFVTCPCLKHHFKCSPLKQYSEQWLFRENCLILVSLSLLLIVFKKKLLLSHWNQKLSFALFSQQQKKPLHARHRSVLIQVCFFESTGLFSLYHCIRSGTCHFFRGGSKNCRMLSRGGSGHFNPLPREDHFIFNA